MDGYVAEYDPLLARVVPGLVMERRLTPSSGSRLRRRGGPPVIEVVGVGAAEMTAVLDALGERYAGVLPINDRDVPIGQGDVVNSLWHLSMRACGLGRDVAHRRPMKFPRFALGLLAYEWARRNERWDLAALENAHRVLLSELQKKKAQNPAQQADAALREVEAAVGNTSPGGVLVLLSLLVRLVLLRPRPDRVAVRWWGTVLRVPPRTVHPRPEAVMTQLVKVIRPRQGGGLPGPWNSPQELLAAALLADIDAYYTAYRRLNRDRPPVVLLPGTHTREGRAFLDLLLGAYDNAFRHIRAGRTITRPVVIALAAGTDAADDAADGLPDIGELALALEQWRADGGESARGRWLLRVAAPRTAEVRG